MGKYLRAAERLSDHLWLLRGVFDRPERHRLACALAAETLGCHAHGLALTTDTNGRPTLNAPLSLNLSYRDGLLLVGMADSAMGVDVEWVDGDYADVARDQFSPGECRWLASIRQPDAFTRLWTGKEAVLKATGQGIALGMAEPDFAPLLRLGLPFEASECEIDYGGRIFGLHWRALTGNRPALAASALLRHPLVTIFLLTFSCPRAAPPCGPKRGDGVI
ncbi:MAG: 4'-phosphopantetheinyl transferase superfamily protein [Rhodospirillaceae bacterium]|nr:4'-phosphopantetheinyl transferase superfamily protein [Rhodospirillales bacterium]